MLLPSLLPPIMDRMRPIRTTTCSSLKTRGWRPATLVLLVMFADTRPRRVIETRIRGESPAAYRDVALTTRPALTGLLIVASWSEAASRRVMKEGIR